MELTNHAEKMLLCNAIDCYFEYLNDQKTKHDDVYVKAQIDRKFAEAKELKQKILRSI